MVDTGRRTLLIGLLLLGGCLFDPYGNLTEVGPVSPEAAECGACHVAIYEEFRLSTHASSWTNPAFVDATAGHLFGDCLGCHAPDSVFTEGEPHLRDSWREEGVTCISCHFDEGVMAGPAPPSALVDPHPVAAEREIYRQSDLCGKCHQGTFEEWRAAPVLDKKTCQDCHMEPVTRKLTQSTGFFSSLLVSLEEEYEGRAHTFHLETVDHFENALAVRLENVNRGSDSVAFELVLENQLPHLIPTGDFGFRRVAVRIDGLDSKEQVIDTREEELFKELGQALLPLEPRRFAAEFPGVVTRVNLHVTSSSGGGAERQVFDGEFTLP